MQSRGISQNSEHVTFSVCYLIEVLLWRGTYCWKPHLNRISGSKVMSNWMVVKTIETKIKSFLLLAVSHNQCSRLSTDSARSQHILKIRANMYVSIIVCFYVHGQSSLFRNAHSPYANKSYFLCLLPEISVSFTLAIGTYFVVTSESRECAMR